MTDSLYARIDAIESFAADVAHELKNPLTSLRSAVETLPLVKNDDSRKRLLDVIEHEVRRLDRLITDISDASRLDAELGRDDLHLIDLAKLLQEHVDAATGEHHRGRSVDITLAIDGFGKKTDSAMPSVMVRGHDLRLGQVVHNLIDNARGFVPEHGGRILLRLSRKDDVAEVTVEDNGPGIRADAFEKVFERFYTDRPGIESFGQNSGLGLSISRQIVEGHGGTLSASNALDKTGKVTGARFLMQLPLDLGSTVSGRVSRRARNQAET
jgi:two-component system, OmpR family, sensor histidine kinase ChvG